MNSEVTRRDFVRSLGRYVSMGALFGLTLKLGLRSVRRKHIFSGDGLACPQCRAVTYCRLPEAVRVRAAGAGAADWRVARLSENVSEITCPYLQS